MKIYILLIFHLPIEIKIKSNNKNIIGDYYMSNGNNEIIINSTIGNTRIVLTKNQVIDNIFIERPDHQRSVGNIYKGKVHDM